MHIIYIIPKINVIVVCAGMSSSAYAEAQGASETTKAVFDQVNLTSPGLNYGMVQSASTSSEFVSRCLVKQKRKYAKK